jgi:photosystem II stability/assembly factor-like uncharacterized protein
VFYLNGEEGGRAYMPGGTITYETLALGKETGNNYRTYDVSAQIPNLVAGTNSIAIEVHQVSRSSSDLVIDVELIAFVEPGEPPHEPTPRGIPAGSTWSYWDRGGDLGTAWRQPDYVETGWAAGAAPLGFGEPEIATQTRGGVVTTYLRHQFTSNGNASGLYLEALYDDGFVAYLNGVEILRASMPTGPITATTLAQSHEADGYARFMLTEATSLIVPGVNTLAIELHQNAVGSSDLVWDARLVEESAWQAQDSGTTADLHDVGAGFVAAWAVGAGGTLLYTPDGETWGPLPSGTTASLNAIYTQAYDDGDPQEEVLIVGDDGTILVGVLPDSTTFVDRSLAEPADLTSVWCNDLCVAVARGDGDDTTADLYVSSDQGQTWTARPTGIPGGSWEAVYFADNTRGWIAGRSFDDEGGAIYGTTDAGLTWTRQWASPNHGGYPAALAKQWNGNVWMVGQSSLSGVGEVKMVTRDGVTWEDHTVSDHGGIYDVVFRGPGVGVGVGFMGAIVITQDGGQTWTVTRQPHHYVHATLSGVAYPFSGGGDFYAVGAGGTILKTTTDGIDVGWVEREAPVFPGFDDVDFVDHERGYAVAGGRLYETFDGGDTWAVLPAPVGAWSVGVVDAQHLWAWGGRTIWVSRDGGATFTQVPSPDGTFVRDVWFASPTHGWLVVQNYGGAEAPSDLYRTVDGGLTWQRSPTGMAGDWNAVWFADAQRGWMVGVADWRLETATVVSTDDGGLTWEPEWTAAEEDFRFGLSDVQAAGNTIWAVGGWLDEQLRVVSRDGGATWSATVDDARALASVWVEDETHAWAGGGDHTIMGTRDGERWELQTRPTVLGPVMTELDFVDRHHGWAVGWTELLETHTGGY